MTRHGRPIQNIQLKYKLDTGIEIKEVPGIVPSFYEIKACNAANYEYYGSWQELEDWQKAKLIGHYFLDNLINGAKDDTVQDKIKLDQKKRGNK